MSGGPVNSPQLLKLSGLGPQPELARHGIDVVHELPGVGENLQDHLEFYFQVACTQPITLYSQMTPYRKALIGLRWMLRKDGLGATNHFETGGFIRSRAGERYPDIQYHFLPMAVSYDGSSLAREHGFQAHVGPMRSNSRGWVRLASANALDKPKVFFNYMSEPGRLGGDARLRAPDARDLCANCLRSLSGPRDSTGRGVQTDAQIDDFIRQHVQSAYHPSCSCRMGSVDDPMAVVDPHTRVIGVEALRVVDSSIMPSITNGNLNAPTIMLAEKAADHILGKPLLPAADVPFYEARTGRARSARHQ